MTKRKSQVKTKPLRTEQIERSDEAEYVTLRELRASPAPVGCWRIKTVLHEAGIEMSEATAGRLLKELDSRGLTKPLGVKGRVLTEQGQHRAEMLEDIRQRWAYQDDLMQAIRPETIKDILDLLIARRTVEVETARLAATRMSEVDIEQLKTTIDLLKDRWLGRGGKRGQNPIIHQIIAKASGNRVFLALVNLLYENQELGDTLFVIQRVMKSIDPEEHDDILRAMLARDSERAAAAMRIHFDRLIEVVEHYGETYPGDQSIIGSQRESDLILGVNAGAGG